MLRFRVVDANRRPMGLTRGYGGVWDSAANRGLGQYSGWYDADGIWAGGEPEPGPGRVVVIDVAEQQWPYIWDFNHRVILAEGGRRSGKSAALAPKAGICALYHPNKRGVILSPTYRQAKNVWNHILRFLPRHWFLPGTLGVNKTQRMLRLANGAEIVLMHAHQDDASRSEGCAWGGYDERQDISEEAAANAFLSTSEGGEDFCIFETATIKAELREHHDHLESWEDGQVYRMISRGNPFISHKLFDAAEQFLDRSAIQRELEAQWPELVGRCYFPFISEPGGHIRDAPLREGRHTLEDITASLCAERFNTPPYGDTAAQVIIGVDPPHHAVVYKVLRRWKKDDPLDYIIHAIDEVIVGRDNLNADVRKLAEACKSRYPGGVVIRDPHEVHHAHDTDRYFRQQGYRMAHMPRVYINSRLDAMRARMERDCWYVDPRCVHLIEALELQTFVKSKPDKNLKSKTIPHMTLDHIADAAGYPVYRLWPPMTTRQFEEQERVA